MKIPVIGLGAGGHARVLIEAARLGTEFEVVGLLDTDPALHGQQVLGIPVLGDDRFLPGFVRQGVRHFFLGLGATRGGRARQRLFEAARENGLQPVSIIHPAAIISPSACVGPGTVVLAGAIVATQAQLGQNVIVNTGAIIEHDCVIGDHVHVATGARLAGAVTVGRGTLVGIGASVRQGLRIGDEATIGAGAAVIHDVPDSAVVAGVPARPLEARSP